MQAPLVVSEGVVAATTATCSITTALVAITAAVPVAILAVVIAVAVVVEMIFNLRSLFVGSSITTPFES
ncbi:hypothetical protein [Hydrococcus rivularis]|uniref:hypothetical protein n=1 Tax=Hydrococcus rivularis TaxID=1616834 RepID=UPI0011149C30|nr:hypothetical protein [Hydrococcus rivularis]